MGFTPGVYLCTKLKLALNLFLTKYEPETNVSPEFNLDQLSYFQILIRIILWMIELGHIGMATKVSLLSLHLVMPHEGRMDAALYIMAYLGLHHNSHLYMNQNILS